MSRKTILITISILLLILGLFIFAVLKSETLSEASRGISKGFKQGLAHGAGSFGAAFNNAYKEKFLIEFENSFVESCRKANPSSEYTKQICECSAKGTIQQLSIEQLKDESFAREHVVNKIVPACKEEVNLKESFNAETESEDDE
ncbi:MAG TPA: hypothetical protein PKA63_09755 [Oligoflexia bacterium]|nr:hypothetical protein [Oligoflexia bacterium]HMP48939.1 hypothetical protein [Oligoflexia bacterium]